MLAEGERSQVIVLEYVPLESPQKAPLDKHLGYLRLDGHRVQVRDKTMLDVGLPLELPLADPHVPDSTDSEQLDEGGLQGYLDEALDESVDSEGLLWSCPQSMEVLAYQRELVVIQRHVRLVQHLLLHNASLPSRDCALEHVKLPLIPAPILGLLSHRTDLEDPPEELSAPALGQPAPLEELE